MGVIAPLFLILKLKKKELLQSLEKRLCCGIKDWGISERRVFDYYTIKGMVEGMSNFSLDFDFCEHCLYGKQNRVRFPSGATRAKGILHLVHSDVFGPMSVPSLGKIYILCLIYR
jgi:hypothetical protein